MRAAGPADVEALRELERAAGAPFRSLGMDAIADDEPPTAAELLGPVRAGAVRVVDQEGRIAAYLLAEPLDGALHVEQVSVHPDHARRRLGRALLEDAAATARRAELPALTLTTFVEVPWNGPYYLRCGFRWLAEEELTPGLRAVRAAERARGLDRWPRGCMIRMVRTL
ncbi:GNAT family N-acetyltransferase [Pseudonocardia yuanmonensis]|uniref:GNAT family N-acetyltransferase n=1 Tax=Pseudonocardia yuanmonensis TaxID=1095914 RepID=UPI0031EA66F7